MKINTLLQSHLITFQMTNLVQLTIKTVRSPSIERTFGKGCFDDRSLAKALARAVQNFVNFFVNGGHVTSLANLRPRNLASLDILGRIQLVLLYTLSPPPEEKCETEEAEQWKERM
jgi:hypothetical protein